MNKKYYIMTTAILVLAVALLLDGRDQFTYFADLTYDNYFSLSNLNVENWTTFVVGILAVFGTWYVTNSSAKEQINNEQKLRKNQVVENRGNLLLDKLSDLKIYYFIKNILEDNSNLNIELGEYVFLPVNNVDVSYIEWQREINIINEYLRFRDSELRVDRPIKFYPFDKQQISKVIMVNRTDLMLLISIDRLRNIKLDINELLIFIMNNQEKEKFDYITDDMKKKMELISRAYFDNKIDYLRLDYQQFSIQSQEQIMAINSEYSEFKDKINRLIELYSDGNSWDEFEAYYTMIFNYLEKYNMLQMIYHEGNEKNLYMTSIKGKSLSFLKTVNVDTTSDYLPLDANIQLMIDVKEFEKIVGELDLQKSRLPD